MFSLGLFCCCCLLLDLCHSLSTPCVDQVRPETRDNPGQINDVFRDRGGGGIVRVRTNSVWTQWLLFIIPVHGFLRRKMVNSRSTWLHTKTLSQSQTPVEFLVPGVQKTVKPGGYGETVLTGAYLTWPERLLTLTPLVFCVCLFQTQTCVRNVHTKSWLLDVHRVLWRA